MRQVAGQANAAGRYDAVIHNAGIGYREAARVATADGLEHVFAVNVLAPYLLTGLIERPARLVYLSSGMHRGGSPDLDDPQWAGRRWNGSQAYADSKLFDVLLAFAVARRWPDVLSNALEPGWVPTRMGGPGAPDDLSLAPVTQAWLAVSSDAAAAGDRRLLLPPAAARHPPRRPQRRPPGPAAQLLRRPHQRHPLAPGPAGAAEPESRAGGQSRNRPPRLRVSVT